MFTKRVWIAGALSLGLIGAGAAGASFLQAQAADAGNAAAAAAPNGGNTQQADHHGHFKKPHGGVEFNVKSSVQLTPDQQKDARQAAEAAMQAELSKYAKISLDDAKAAATKADPGAAIQKISLRQMRGNLVYMAVLTKDNQRTMVVIDAGNGSVLKQKTFTKQDKRAKQADSAKAADQSKQSSSSQ